MWVAKLVAAWIAVVVGLLAGIILWKIWSGKIDLAKLISEADGDASMSRFQFLIFTFVIALMWLYLFFYKDWGGFVDIPGGVLALLGISGGSYVVSKGIQKTHETEVAKAKADAARPAAPAASPNPPAVAPKP